mmetsp:Transcript_63123/g.138227  ORF Transcript_63123/g.138227 Transcript_63123/m.138227 type:complete len:96 (+) Transcript_63123:126-413(+)
MRLKLEFSGGLELLFAGQKELDVDAPLDKPTVAHLLPWMRDNLVKERPELFMKGDTVRPGILVLINDSDWELCGMLEAELTEGDQVVFISTLHGG